MRATAVMGTVLILSGITAFHFFREGDKEDALDVRIFEGVFFAVSTCSTAGIYTIRERTSTLDFYLAALAMLIGVPAWGYFIGVLSSSVVEAHENEAREKRLTKEVSTTEWEQFHQKWGNGDGKCDQREFVLMMLLRLGSVDLALIERIDE